LASWKLAVFAALPSWGCAFYLLYWYKSKTLTQKALQFKREKEQGQFGLVKNEKSKEDAQKEKKSEDRESAKHVNEEASRDEVHREKKEAGKQIKKESTRDDVAQKDKKDPGKQKK